MKALLIMALLLQASLSVVAPATTPAVTPAVAPATTPAKPAPAPHQIPAQDFIRAINKVRANPKAYADYVKVTYLDKGVNGTKGDPMVYFNLEAQMRNLEPRPPLIEKIACDLAAWRHADWMATNKIFAHRGINGSSPQARLLYIGKFEKTGKTDESIAGAGGRPTAEFFVNMWLTDAGTPSRGHQRMLLSLKPPRVSTIGCGYSRGNAVCVTADPIDLLPTITDEDLAQAGLSRAVNGVNFTGL